jgi:murein L,D-transpeptidase YafK
MKLLSAPLAVLVLLGAVAAKDLPDGAVADRILVEKAERRLTLLRKDEVLKIYEIALGPSPEGPKEREGDGKTPEGIYRISGRNPNSRYHRSLRISYPGPQDVARAKAAGVSPGGDIMIHGLMNGLGWIGSFHTSSDWTEGCIAVTNQEIEEIWRVVRDGTPVEIRP